MYEIEIDFKYHDLSDELLVDMSRHGNMDTMNFLTARYRNMVRHLAKGYFLVGGDREDIIQEGMIGLYKAIRDYKIQEYGGFKSFAKLCIERQIQTAVKTAVRLKHAPLNTSISLDKPINDEEQDRTLGEMIPGKTIEPLVWLVEEETMSMIRSKLSDILTDIERTVFFLYFDGLSYVEIADVLNRQVKSVDNALQRIKRKVERRLSAENLLQAVK